ncbi:hypothetical protein TNCV_2128561 [Trichonephila clavipes]|nr:hypothetical protein TNCV_2128561 [Trichonephila clavipes]
MNQLLLLPTADCSPFNSIKSGQLPVTLGWLVNDWPNNYVQNYSRNGAYWLPIGLLDPVAVQRLVKITQLQSEFLVTILLEPDSSVSSNDIYFLDSWCIYDEY